MSDHELGLDIGETDRQALDRFDRTPWDEVHPGVWTSLLQIANDWYEQAHIKAHEVARLSAELEAAKQIIAELIPYRHLREKVRLREDPTAYAEAERLIARALRDGEEQQQKEAQ